MNLQGPMILLQDSVRYCRPPKKIVFIITILYYYYFNINILNKRLDTGKV